MSLSEQFAQLPPHTCHCADQSAAAAVSRPGFVLEVDRSTPPILFHHGEGFRLEQLPAGSRVVYPAEPVAPLADPDGAIRHAL